MQDADKGRRFVCTQCGVLFFLKKTTVEGQEVCEKPVCPHCGSKEVTSIPNVVTK